MVAGAGVVEEEGVEEAEVVDAAHPVDEVGEAAADSLVEGGEVVDAEALGVVEEEEGEVASREIGFLDNLLVIPTV